MIAANDTQIKYAQTVNTRIAFGVLFASYASTVLIASSLQLSFEASDDIFLLFYSNEETNKQFSFFVIFRLSDAHLTNRFV